MTRSKTPSYWFHKPSGRARVRIHGRDHWLGPYGSDDSYERYDELIEKWEREQRKAGRESKIDQITVNQAIARFWSHAKKRYGKRGKGKYGNAVCWRPGLRLLRKRFGDEPLRDFGPRKLKRIVEDMVLAGWSRGYIKDQLMRVKAAFNWMVTEELLSGENLAGIMAVKLSTVDVSDAERRPPVDPVADEVVDATLRFLPTVVADMVRFQRYTGCRPAEVCIIRPCDVDRSTKDCWVYTPHHHKTEHQGKQRRVYVGPRAQVTLLRYLLRPATEYCFSPGESEQRRRKLAHAQRQTPLAHGNRPGSNRAELPIRIPGFNYTTDSYRRAIHRGCDKAFPPPEDLRQKQHETQKEWIERLTTSQRKALALWQSRHRWSPNQLRHTAGTAIRAEFGVETAQAVLGHCNLSTTEIYAERSAERAIEAAKKLG